MQALGLAVDGLFRDAPGAFVHGAMAWDVLFVGWRSQYGATVLGKPELVASQGNYFFGKQAGAPARLRPPAARVHPIGQH